MPLVCVEKGLKRDQGRKGVQVCGRLPRSRGRGIGQCQACTLLGREQETVVKCVLAGGGRVCPTWVFCKFVGDFIQQAVFKASSVTGPELGPKGNQR